MTKPNQKVKEEFEEKLKNISYPTLRRIMGRTSAMIKEQNLDWNQDSDSRQRISRIIDQKTKHVWSFIDSALTKQKKELVKEITEELKKQIIYIRARTEREYRDKDNIIFNGVSYHYMDVDKRRGFVLALEKTIEYLSLLQKDKEEKE